MSQKQRVLNYINEFGSISPKEAFEDLGAYRLSAIIYDLKKDGHNIKTEIERSKNRYGETTHYARYSFVEQDKMIEENMNHIPMLY